MGQAFILMVVGATSLGAYLLGLKAFGYSGYTLRQAIARACECLGLMVLFAALNLAVGMLAVLGVRWLTGWFVSLYIAADLTLVLLAALQALLFQAWRQVSAHSHPTEGRVSDPLPRQP